MRMKDEESQPVQGQERKSTSDMLCDVGAVLISFFVLIGAFAIPIAMIVIGSGGLGKCPAERMIPVYLLVGGIAFIVVLPLTFVMKAWESCVRKDSPMTAFFKCYNGLFFYLLAVFFFVWFICGNVWVYRTREVVFTGNKDSSPIYCDELTYKFAYWVIIATYVCSVLSCIFTACIRKRLHYDDVK